MVSIILIGHNSKPYLLPCIRSIVSQVNVVHETIFIDNNSIDGSIEFVKENYPEIHHIKMETNVGYARAANIGIKLSTFNYIMILNPDVLLEPDYLYICLSEIEKRSNCAGVSGKIYKYDYLESRKTKIIDTTGFIASRGRRFLDNGAGILDSGQFSIAKEVFGISGNCALLRKLALEDIKVNNEYYDEDFFMFKEDVDICWRMRLRGWSFYYAPKAIAFHKRSTGADYRLSLIGTINARRKLNNMQKLYSFRNHTLLIIKNETPGMFLHDFPFIIARELILIFWICLFEKNKKEIFSCTIKKIPSAINKRRIIMGRKKIAEKAIISWFRNSGIAKK